MDGKLLQNEELVKIRCLSLIAGLAKELISGIRAG